MIYLRNSFSLLFTFLIFPFSNAQANDSIISQFAPPLDFPLMISGNFGDVRASSFHFGIDFMTRGKIGWPVYSIADGYVARVKVEPGGYGRAIYIKHNDGTMSVFCHLTEYYAQLDTYVKEKQYAEKSFYQDIALVENQFPVKKCDVIGYSGNSGQSSGPHLHFEIRDYNSQNPMNGMLATFPIEDKLSPKFSKLWIYDNFNYIDANGLYKKSYNIQSKNGHFFLLRNRLIKVPSAFYIGIEAFDNLTDSDRKLSYFSSKLMVDSVLIFHQQFDEMQFDQTGSVNAFIDNKYKLTNNENIIHQFLFPNQELVSVRYADNRGQIYIHDSTVHNVNIQLSDIAGNTSVLDFQIQLDSAYVEQCKKDTSLYFLPYKVENTISVEKLKVVFPSKSLYADVFIDAKTISTKADIISKAYVIGDLSIPVKKPFKLFFNLNGDKDSIKKKFVVVAIDEEGSRSSIGGEIQNNKLVASAKYFGVFGIAIDTIAPKIVPLNISNRKNMSAEKEIKFKITDELSGIGEYRCYIDNKWTLFEYDQKSNTLTHTFDKERFLLNKKSHTLKVYVTDKRNNGTLLSLTFIK
jgi:hypothetical protein